MNRYKLLTGLFALDVALFVLAGVPAFKNAHHGVKWVDRRHRLVWRPRLHACPDRPRAHDARPARARPPRADELTPEMEGRPMFKPHALIAALAPRWRSRPAAVGGHAHDHRHPPEAAGHEEQLRRPRPKGYSAGDYFLTTGRLLDRTTGKPAGRHRRRLDDPQPRRRQRLLRPRPRPRHPHRQRPHRPCGQAEHPHRHRQAPAPTPAPTAPSPSATSARRPPRSTSSFADYRLGMTGRAAPSFQRSKSSRTRGQSAMRRAPCRNAGSRRT